jgi:hypothetical protein
MCRTRFFTPRRSSARGTGAPPSGCTARLDGHCRREKKFEKTSARGER